MTLSLNQFPWTNLLSKYAFFTKPHGSPRLPLRTLWSVKDDGDEKRARPPLFFRVGVAVPHRLLAGPPAKQPKQKLPQFSLAGAPPLSGTFPTFRGGGVSTMLPRVRHFFPSVLHFPTNIFWNLFEDLQYRYTLQDLFRGLF